MNLHNRYWLILSHLHEISGGFNDIKMTSDDLVEISEYVINCHYNVDLLQVYDCQKNEILYDECFLKLKEFIQIILRYQDTFDTGKLSYYDLLVRGEKIDKLRGMIDD